MNICKKCVLPENFPGIRFYNNGICNFCNEAELYKKPSFSKKLGFSNEAELIQSLEKYRNPNRKYDVLVPLSGGVDSSHALIKIAETYKLKSLAFHYDNGYEDPIATDNAKKLCMALDVDLLIFQQGLSFMKKLWKYTNEFGKGLSVCYVCGNILYLTALEIANQFHIPLVINGYSKGDAEKVNDREEGIRLLQNQIDAFEKSGDKDFINQFINKYKIIEKRINYQSREELEKETDSEKILVVPFYLFQFYQTDKKKKKKEVRKRFDWQPMAYSYPGRTTNCKMVWLNTYADLKKMNYTRYHEEYAGLVRKGEITREQALKDLEFNPPEEIVERLAEEIWLDLDKIEKYENHVSSEKQNPIIKDIKDILISPDERKEQDDFLQSAMNIGEDF